MEGTATISDPFADGLDVLARMPSDPAVPFLLRTTGFLPKPPDFGNF